MKPLVIYHDKCADGFGAAFAAWMKLGDEAEYLPMQYGQEHTKFDTALIAGREVFILDFSFPKGIMNLIFAQASRVVWLDHHKTAFEMWCGVQYLDRPEGVHQAIGLDAQHTIILNNFKSGAMLAWEYFHPDTEVPMLIRHIDDYDRWQFKLEGTKEFNKALWSYAPWSFDQWHDVLDLNNPVAVEQMIDEGWAILRAHEQNVASVVKGATRECSIRFDDDRLGALAPWNHGGYWACNGLAANCPPHLASDVGHELATQSGTFGLLWSINKDGACQCSLRSNGTYDVSAIAKAFGGGGHRNAAGFEVPVETLLGWLK